MSKATISWLLLAILGLIWGSSFILMKRGMHAIDGTLLFSSVQVASLRMLIAGLIFLPFSVYFFRKITEIKHLLFFGIVGFFGNFFPAYLFTYAETGLSTSLTGILNSLTPIFTLLIGLMLFKKKIHKLQVVGLLIAASGVSVLLLSGKDVSLSGSYLQISAVVGATLCYAISVNVIKYSLANYSAIEIASIAFSLTLIPSLYITFDSGAIPFLEKEPKAMEGLFFIGILSVFGTAISLVLFNRLIALSSTLFASSVTYLIPLVAVCIGIQFGETINYTQVLGMIVILLGVYFSNK